MWENLFDGSMQLLDFFIYFECLIQFVIKIFILNVFVLVEFNLERMIYFKILIVVKVFFLNVSFV